MTYAIISAAYANSDRSAIVMMTKEAGAVAISRNDSPKEWNALLSSGVNIAPYVEVAAVPSVVSAFQAKAALMQVGRYVEAENAAAAADIMTALAWQTAGEFQRSSPAIAALADKLGLSDADVDALFIAAAKISA